MGKRVSLLLIAILVCFGCNKATIAMIESEKPAKAIIVTE